MTVLHAIERVCPTVASTVRDGIDAGDAFGRDPVRRSPFHEAHLLYEVATARRGRSRRRQLCKVHATEGDTLGDDRAAARPIISLVTGKI
jgi:hypothetical protein